MDATTTDTRPTKLKYCVCTHPDGEHEEDSTGACVFCDCPRFRAEPLPQKALL